MALAAYEGQLCPGCRQPIALAWHSDMDGYYDAESYVCHACTARSDSDEKTRWVIAHHTRDLDANPVPPFVLGVTTTSD
ncbi:hypothetical protein QWY28_13220 [Nocardioides sp. SOB77]|uniref:Uncharacterized protein n=1 Tax=Nocardioides oceani TaxID=3058369 RepID=A0ABT8FHI6_9ACTN|nr:hypothetical protein [Nocardioides oceani]MDN4173915.1 hypothetical protein [Nocardioides oceani]